MIPAFIDAESFDAFREMRKKIKAPLTPYAEKLIIRELVRLKSAGEDAQACLDQSIMLGWRDVFPVREKQFRNANTARMSDDTEKWLAEQEQARKAASRPPERLLRMVGKA